MQPWRSKRKVLQVVSVKRAGRRRCVVVTAGETVLGIGGELCYGSLLRRPKGGHQRWSAYLIQRVNVTLGPNPQKVHKHA